MIDGFFKKLLSAERTTEPQVWSCSPLVILHPQDGVVYRESTTLTYTPDDLSWTTGSAVADRLGDGGWQPVLIIRERSDSPKGRGGVTLRGFDSDGEPFTWLIGADAESYFWTHRPLQDPGRPENPEPVQRGPLTDLELMAQIAEQDECVEGLRRVVADLLVVTVGDDRVVWSAPAEFDLIPLEGQPGVAWATAEKLSKGISPDLYALNVEEDPEGLAGLAIMGVNGRGERSNWLTKEVARDMLAVLGEDPSQG